MAFNSANSMCGVGQMDRQACLYSAMNPYAYNSVSTSQNLYLSENAKLQTYAQGLMMQRLPTTSSYGHNLFPQSFSAASNINGNELSMFPSISMALDVGHLEDYGKCNSAGFLKPAFQCTGILDASNPLKCPKPVHPFYWRKRGNSVPAEGMTRTKDKYRVVYTDKQRVGLEKEFKTNKFITMQRKTELSKQLDLSERQIKIWFQNRRAKERRQKRKTETSDDHVTNEELLDTTSAQIESTVKEKDVTNDVLFTSHNYPSLKTLEEPVTGSQCRFQQNSDRFRETEIIPGTHVNQSTKRFPMSPSEWSQTSALMSNCNVSPFTANPDWNLVYRS